jgi:hypothetical protein
MAQTPVSASAIYNSTTPTTIYTVPATKTAVVKGVLASSLVTTFDTVTLNKVSGGVTYPLVRGQLTGYTSWTAQTAYPAGAGVQSINLLQSPITLAAGDSISISTTGTAAYKTETVVNNSNYRIANINYLNGNYIAVGQDIVTGYGLILTSTDGITFTSRTFTASVTLVNSTYGNGYYVVSNSTGGTIHYSTDLITWTQVSLPSTNACWALTYGGGKFVTGGGSGYSYYATTTPLSWTEATVFNGSTIYSIAYIGTDYFYGNQGVSYYTPDFTNYTQPYVYLLGGNTQNKNGNFAVTNNKILAVNALTANANPNTFLTSSPTGATWSNVTTVGGNSLANYSTYICYTNNGGHMIYRTTSAGQNYYLYSSDGVSWAESNTSGLTGETQTANAVFRGAYDNTTNSTLNNKVLGFFNTSQKNFFCYNQNATGVQSTINWQFASTQASNGNAQFQSFPCFVANPIDESWIALAFYSQGGNITVAYWYGTSATQQSGDSQFAQTFANNGYGQGYSVSAGVVPGATGYLVGTQNGWVITGNYSGIGSPLIQSGVYGPNPPGINFSLLSGSACVGFARSGNTATSTLVILWANGQIAVSTNQTASFTQKSIGASSFTQMSSFGGSPIKYNNGQFVAINTSGLVLTSTNGLDWVSMPANIESIYYLNSQNVFLSSTNLTTSATGVVSAFTGKTNPGAGVNPTVNRMVYANSTYYLMDTNAIMYTSSDLVTWTGRSFNSQQINNTNYISQAGMGLAYSGTGTAILPSAAQPTPASGIIGKVFTPSVGTVVGNATASIVQID